MWGLDCISRFCLGPFCTPSDPHAVAAHVSPAQLCPQASSTRVHWKLPDQWQRSCAQAFSMESFSRVSSDFSSICREGPPFATMLHSSGGRRGQITGLFQPSISDRSTGAWRPSLGPSVSCHLYLATRVLAEATITSICCHVQDAGCQVRC